MSDFNGSKPVRTERDNEFKIVIVDGASGDSATKKMSVVAEGEAYSASSNDLGVPLMGKNASGDAIILPVPLPITDNGGAITVDGTVSISGDVNVTATDLDIRALTFATDSVDVSGSSVTVSGTVDIGNTVTVQATDLDIRDLSHTQDSVKIGDGSEFLAINPDGSINTNTVISGKICEYNSSATVGVNTEVLHFHVVASGKTFSGKDLLVGARGAVKVRFGISTDGLALSTVKGVYFQDPKENIDHSIECLELLGDGTKAICVGITNLDGSSSDVYSTIQGSEV